MAQRSELSFPEFIASSSPAPPILLIYGNDAEKVDAACISLIEKIKSEEKGIGALQRADAGDIAKDPARLMDLFSSVGLFGEVESLLVSGVSEKHSKLLRSFFNSADATGSDARLILTSHDLKRKSALLEQAKARADCVVISAYDTAISGPVLRSLAKSRGLDTIDGDAFQRLEQYAAQSTTTLVTQLIDKLALAAPPHGAASIELVDACLPEAADSAADEIAADLLSGSPQTLLASLERIRANGGPDSQFVSALGRICLDIKRVQKGHAHTRARPLFWKTEKVVRSAEQRLDRFPERVEFALREVYNAEAALRSSDPLAGALAERLCLRLARCFAPSRRSR